MRAARKRKATRRRRCRAFPVVAGDFRAAWRDIGAVLPGGLEFQETLMSEGKPHLAHNGAGGHAMILKFSRLFFILFILVLLISYLFFKHNPTSASASLAKSPYFKWNVVSNVAPSHLPPIGASQFPQPATRPPRSRAFILREALYCKLQHCKLQLFSRCPIRAARWGSSRHPGPRSRCRTSARLWQA